MLGSKVEACKSPRNNLKVVSIVEMTHLYGASGSFVLLRPKNRVKIFVQSAENWICMGNGLYQVGQFIVTTLPWSILYRDFFKMTAYLQTPQ